MSADCQSDRELKRMGQSEVAQFLSTQRMGVLGLPGAGVPYLRPTAFWYDSEDHLYLLHEYGPHPPAQAVSRDVASFLVFRAETPYVWRSVLLTGSLQRMSADQVDRRLAGVDLGLVPVRDAREESGSAPEAYVLAIEEARGIKCVSCPPGLAPEGRPPTRAAAPEESRPRTRRTRPLH